MRFKFSGAIVSDLGYDDSQIVQAQPLRASIRTKGRSGDELTADELAVLVWDAKHLISDENPQKGRERAFKRRLVKALRAAGHTAEANEIEWDA